MNPADIQQVAQRHFASVRGELGLPDYIAERAELLEPLQVRTLDGRPSYWLVPIAVSHRLVGFLRLGLDGCLLAYGRYGQAGELAEFPPLSYLSQEAATEEMAAFFGLGADEIDTPQLVHDGPEDRIVWLSRSRAPGYKRLLLFWIFGTAYSRPEKDLPDFGML